LSAARPLDPFLGDVLDLLAERVAERVLERMGPKAVQVAYTTAKHGPHIPNKTRRWMMTWVRKMPGARKVGRDWHISAEDYEAWSRAEDERRCSTPRPPLARTGKLTSSSDEAELAHRAERSLRAQGFRPTVK
jgi:hypothetical protein